MIQQIRPETIATLQFQSPNSDEIINLTLFTTYKVISLILTSFRVKGHLKHTKKPQTDRNTRFIKVNDTLLCTI